MSRAPCSFDVGARRVAALHVEPLGSEHDLREARALEHLVVHVAVTAPEVGGGARGVDHDLSARGAAVRVEADGALLELHAAVGAVQGGAEFETDPGGGRVEREGLLCGARGGAERDHEQQRDQDESDSCSHRTLP